MTTILLCEDEADLRALYQLVLQHAGYTVVPVTSAEAARAVLLAAPAPIQVLVTDVHLPGRRGEVLVRWLRGWQAEVRTILMSQQPENAWRAARCQADAWYWKGAPVTALLALVARWAHDGPEEMDLPIPRRRQERECAAIAQPEA